MSTGGNEKMKEMKVKIGWFLFCPIMIFDGAPVPRRIIYKYLFIAAIWIRKVMVWIQKAIIMILYIIGFKNIEPFITKPLVILTGETTIYIEE